MTEPLANTAAEALRAAVTTIEALHDEQANLSAAVAGAYRDAKAAGLDNKALYEAALD
jgi:uncharacterized protein (UPF0335 family)